MNSLLQPFLGHRSFLFSPAWTRSSCWCKNQALLNSFSHRSHGTLAAGTDFPAVKSRFKRLKPKAQGVLETYLGGFFCASNILSTSLLQTDTPPPHRCNLQQRGSSQLHSAVPRERSPTCVRPLVMHQFSVSWEFSGAAVEGTAGRDQQ